jgi:hypothetical protein
MNKSIVHSTKEDSLISLKISDPYYRGKPLFICIAKEWFDKVNGNSYWSARVEDIENDITYIFPFQYHFPCFLAFPIKSFGNSLVNLRFGLRASG